MNCLFLKRRVNVRPLYDMVVMTFGNQKPKVPYQTAIEICNGIRMAAKMAMRYEGNKAKEWRKFIELDKDEFVVRAHSKFRRSREVPTVKNWRVDWKGAIVVLCLDELTVQIHYAEALELYMQIRVAARQSKAWAGDRSYTKRVTAYLNDGEENYKYGYS